MESDIGMTESIILDLKQSIEKLSSMKEPEPDDLVIIENSVEKQMFSLVAKEQSLEDLIYVVGKLFMSHGVDLNTFLKWIRAVSRDLFLTKALLKKVTASLPHAAK